MLFVDTETYLIVPGLLAPPLVVGSFCTGSGDPWLLEKDRAASAVEYAIQNEEVIVGHHVAFDLAVIVAHRPHLLRPVFEHYRKGLVRDTKIRMQLLDIASGELKFHEAEDGTVTKTSYTLAAIAKRLLGIEVAKGGDTYRLRYRELDGVPLEKWPEAAREYALNDARITRDVFFAQNNGLPITNEIEQTQAAWALHLMSVWGIRTSPEAVEVLKAKLSSERARIRKTLVKVGFYKGVPFNKEDRDAGRTPDFYTEYKQKHLREKKGPRPMKYGRDMAVIKARVVRQFTRRGLPVPKTDSGEVSTEKLALEQSGSRLLRMLAEAGGIDKLIDTYLPVLESGTTVPINPGFNTLVASGRTSSFAPNLQNVPSGRRIGGVRECFVPRPGFVFSSIDYKTLELRALAEVCLRLFGFSKMAEALREDKDLHLEMASKILGISYEEAKTRKDAGDKEVKKARDLAKIANFGFPGGMGPEALCSFSLKSYGIYMSLETAKRLKHFFLSTWTEMARYFDYIAQSPGLEAEQGRISQLVSNRIRGGLHFTAAANTLFQGMAADGGKAALFDISYESYCVDESPLYGSRPVGWIHDEALTEHPEWCGHEASHRERDIMVSRMADYIQGVPVKAAPVLMKRWSKDAQEVWDGGRLVAWDVPKAA